MRTSGYMLALLLAASGAAQAQDWDGWYAGLGYERSDYSFDMPLGAKNYVVNNVSNSDYSSDGGTGNGLTLIAGRLWQNDKFVYGLELNLGGSKSGYASDLGSPADSCEPTPCAVLGVSSELQTTGHFRSIIGLASSSKLMVFGSLGVASAKFDVTELFAFGYFLNGAGGSTQTVGFDTKTVYGPSMGIGVQYKMGRSLVLRGEVLRDSYSVDYSTFADLQFGFGSNQDTINGNINTGNPIDGSSFEIDNTTARLSLIYEF